MKDGDICLRNGCSVCCNPVKIASWELVNIEEGNLPFVETGIILAPENLLDQPKFRLKVYYCLNFDHQTGLCGDYDNRPEICRNTTCAAFNTKDKEEQKSIIDRVKNGRYVELTLRK